MRSRKPWPAWLAWPAVLAATAVLFPSCVKFVKLESDVDFMAGTYIISGTVENAERYPRVYGLVVEWDQAKNKCSPSTGPASDPGVFAFFRRGWPPIPAGVQRHERQRALTRASWP
jgi:hypothetical protein